MNREIKFRIWDSDKAVRRMFFSEGLHQIMYGGANDDIGMKLSLHWSVKNSFKGHWRERNFEKDLREGVLILEQFTGLKDKNGVDIYEGDILDFHQTVNGCNLFSVEWDKLRLGWSLKYAQNMVTPRFYEYDVSDAFNIEELEVVGNIHENPAQ